MPVTEVDTGANLHGLLYKESFEVIDKSKNSVTLFYKNTGEIYPFLFEITVKYFIENNKFIQTYNIRNTDSKNMPLTFALHTTFIEPDVFAVPIDAVHTKDKNHIPYGYYDPLSIEQKSYVSGFQSKNNNISGFFHSAGNTAYVDDYIFEVSENFDHWILFNGNVEKGFLCIEPQCGQTNGLNTDDGKIILAKGESISFWSKLSKKTI